MLARNDLADYIADNYGTCSLRLCHCLRSGWVGRECVNWNPVEARNWDELRDAMKQLYSKKAG